MMGGMGLISEVRFMNKAEAQEIHQQIRDEIAKVEATLDRLARSLEAAQTAQTERDRLQAERERLEAVRTIRAQIFQTQRDACSQSGRLRIFLQESVERLRAEFMALTGEEYPPMDCQQFQE
jgi:hypothetical protein